MCISGFHLPLNTITSGLSPERPSRPGSSPSIKKTKSFSLQITDESMKVSQNQTGTMSAESPYFSFLMHYNEFPLKSFSVPGWSGKWFSDLNVMALDKEMRDLDYQQGQYNALSAKKKDELNKYTYAVLSCITESLINHGIKDSADYAKLMQDDELSEEVHQAVTNCLADNPGIMELMHSFGLTLY